MYIFFVFVTLTFHKKVGGNVHAPFYLFSFIYIFLFFPSVILLVACKGVIILFFLILFLNKISRGESNFALPSKHRMSEGASGLEDEKSVNRFRVCRTPHVYKYFPLIRESLWCYNFEIAKVSKVLSRIKISCLFSCYFIFNILTYETKSMNQRKHNHSPLINAHFFWTLRA